MTTLKPFCQRIKQIASCIKSLIERLTILEPLSSKELIERQRAELKELLDLIPLFIHVCLRLPEQNGSDRQLKLIEKLINKPIKRYVCLATKCITRMKGSDKDKVKYIEDFIDDLAHITAHYANTDFGEKLVISIRQGIVCGFSGGCCDGKCDGKEAPPASKSQIFRYVARVQQEYWERKKSHKIPFDPNYKTIRINSLPFAEGLFVYLMSSFAKEYGVNLEIVDVPWHEVGKALLTNRIDVAMHNDSLECKQLTKLHFLADNRQLFKTGKAFEYKGYYLAGKPMPKKDHGNNALRIAVVGDSDHETVLKNWLVIHQKEMLDTSTEYSKYIAPVLTPDEAVAAYIDGTVYRCVVGALHKKYLEDIFLKNEFIKIDPQCGNEEATDVFFWAVSKRKDQSLSVLKSVIAMWDDVVNKWDMVNNGLGEEWESLRNSSLIYLNERPNSVYFYGDYPSLVELLDGHNTKYPMSSDGIVVARVKGW